jgi:hypothetical protein
VAENNKPEQSRKGRTNNPNGRPAGTPNKATMEARAAIGMFVDKNAHRLESWLDAVANGDVSNDIKPNPAKAFELFQSVVEYHVPKLGRTEHTGPGGGPVDHNLTVNFK